MPVQSPRLRVGASPSTVSRSRKRLIDRRRERRSAQSTRHWGGNPRLRFRDMTRRSLQPPGIPGCQPHRRSSGRSACPQLLRITRSTGTRMREASTSSCRRRFTNISAAGQRMRSTGGRRSGFSPIRLRPKAVFNWVRRETRSGTCDQLPRLGAVRIETISRRSHEALFAFPTRRFVGRRAQSRRQRREPRRPRLSRPGSRFLRTPSLERSIETCGRSNGRALGTGLPTLSTLPVWT